MAFYGHDKIFVKSFTIRYDINTKDFQTKNSHKVETYSEFKTVISKGGFIECGWDGEPKTEEKIKHDTKATIRCIPFKQNIKELKCIYSDKPAKYRVIFARAY